MFLARLGYIVDAWDISDVGLQKLQEELMRCESSLHINPRRVDLDDHELPPQTYDLLLDTHFLDRRLFKPMAQALKPGGMLLVRTFLQPPNGRYNPAHALQPGELQHAFEELEVLQLRESVEEETAYLLARRPRGSP